MGSRLDRSGAVEQADDRCGGSVWDHPRHSQVVEKVVTVAQRQHEFRRVAIASKADDDTVNGSVALHLNPLTTARYTVPAIAALGDDPFDRRQQPQPLSSRFYVRGLQNQLQAWV
jgi:hypothetical protein